MRILFIHTRYKQSAGGEDTTVDAESKLLTEKGHEVRVVVFDNGEMGKGILGKVEAGVNAIYNRESARQIRTEIGGFKPDIVHVHNFFFTASPSVLIATHSLGIPLVVTIQNFRLICANCLLLRENKVCELCVTHRFPWFGVWYKCYHNSAVQSAVVGATAAIHKLLNTWTKKVDQYITPANFIRTRLIDSSLKLPEGMISVKRNFINDPGHTDEQSRESYYLFIGRLSVEKGVDLLLKTWSSGIREKLFIAGSGPEEIRLKNTYGHLSNVEFLGHRNREEILSLLKNCRALVFPSIWYEGLPLTIVEAMATATPVIASALGAMKEMIKDGYNGLLFEPGNLAELSAAVERMNTFTAEGNQSMYHNARREYVENYHPEKCYLDVMDIYMKAIQKTKT